MNLSDLTIGDRVELHPATDQWMQGDRYAEVKTVGAAKVTLISDHGNEFRLYPRNILRVVR